MKKLFITILMLIALPVCATNTQKLANNKAPIKVSFVQTADHAELRVVNAKRGIYKLTLSNINHYTTYFSDRPDRVFGQFTQQAFLQKWQQGQDSFSKDAPNAVLSAAIHDANQQDHFVNVLVVLKQPVYHSSNHVMTYTVKVLNSSSTSFPEKVLHHAVLFIDDACLTCIG